MTVAYPKTTPEKVRYAIELAKTTNLTVGQIAYRVEWDKAISTLRDNIARAVHGRKVIGELHGAAYQRRQGGARIRGCNR